MNSDQDSGKVIQDSGKDSPPPNSGHSSNQSAPEYYTSSDNENGIAPPPKYSRGYFNEAFQVNKIMICQKLYSGWLLKVMKILSLNQIKSSFYSQYYIEACGEF